MKTLGGWLIQRVSAGTLTTFALLSLALVIVAVGLVGIVRGLDFDLAFTMTTVGLVSGWLVAKTIQRGLVTGICLVGLGVVFVGVRVGNLSGKLFALTSAVIEFLLQSQRGVLVLTSVSRAADDLGVASGVLFTRLNDWTRGISNNTPVFDPVATALVWGAGLWFCAAWAGWCMRRRAQPVHALVPALTLLAIPFAYGGSEPYLISALLLFLLALMVLVGQSARENQWRKRGMDFSEEIRFDLALWSVPLIVGWVAVTALMPSISIQDLAHWAEEIQRPESDSRNALPDSLGLAAKPRPQTAFDSIISPGLPRSHLIGAGPELARRSVMTIKTNDAPFTSTVTAPRYYWLNSTYDVYFGLGWTTSGASIINYQAGEATGDSTPAFHRLIQQQVHVVGKPDGLLYAPGDVNTADSRFGVAWRSFDDAFSASIAAPAYNVQSFVPTANEKQLENAGANYPPAISARYLALPNTIPSRVLALARDLTATKATPYDRARAIEQYLRAFPYTLDLPEPPTDRDVADYFLFDLKRGYCDYYATAFVVLARAAGLPARLAVGYATGQYDPAQRTYTVTEADAHSWSQVYFPEYGWINFEPTGGRAELDYSGDANLPEGGSSGSATGLPTPATLLSNFNSWLALPFGVALIVLTALLVLFLDSWRLTRLTPTRAIGALYRRLDQFHVRLSPRAQAGDTPYQVAALLEKELAAQPENAHGNSFARAIRDVNAFADLYVRAVYSPDAPDTAERARAIRLWRDLSWRLWLAWLWRQVAARLPAAPHR